MAQELDLCQRKPKKYQHLLREVLQEVVAHVDIVSTTWAVLIDFNEAHLTQARFWSAITIKDFFRRL